MVQQHVSDELLLSYSSGSLENSSSLVVATHTALCPKCRRKVNKYEDLGGEFLMEESSTKPNPNTLSNILFKLDDNEEKKENKASYLDNECFKNIPMPLKKHLPFASTNISENWKSIFGFRYFKIPIDSDNKNIKVIMLALPPDKIIPTHEHQGRELNLVLEGGFSDQNGSYGPGDIITQGVNDAPHTPIADGEGCVCLLVYEGNLIFKGFLGKILNLFKI